MADQQQKQSSPRTHRHRRLDSVSHLELKISRNLDRIGHKKDLKTALLYTQLGNVYFRTNELDKAAEAYSNATKRTSNPSARSDALLNLGTVCWRSGKIPQAIRFLSQALEESSGNLATEASVRHQLGLCLALQGNFPESIGMLEEARVLRTNANQTTAVGKTVDAMGKVYLLQGNLVQALHCHRKAYRILQFCGSRTQTVLSNMAKVHEAAGNLTEALRVWHEVARTAETTNQYEQATDQMKKLQTRLEKRQRVTQQQAVESIQHQLADTSI